MQLEEYAHACNETPERLAGDLIVEGLRASHAPPASWEVPSTEPRIVRDVDREAEAMLDELLAVGWRSDHDVKAEAIARGIPWSAVRKAASVLGVQKHASATRSKGVFWSLPG